MELSLTFFHILAEAFPIGDRASKIQSAFLSVHSLSQLPLPAPVEANFDPIDEGTTAFADMTVGRTLDGFEVYKLAKGTPPTPPTIPTEVTAALNTGEDATLLMAYAAFVTWVEGTFGQIGSGDPKGWNPTQIDYDVKMRFGAGAASVTVDVHPNENGSVDWTSFDLEATTNQPFTGVPITVAHEVPTHTRFPGMPAPRFWDFESGDIPWPDVDATRSEMAKLLVVDFAMLYGVDMFVVPLVLDVAKAVTIDTLVVYDVFGGRVVVDPVEAGRTGSNPDRFTLFTTAVPAATPPGSITNFMCLPPGAGKALQHGPALEEIRFARDEVANMIWGIEAVTESRIGERRRGSERDAAVDAALPPPTPPATDAPLRYQVESKVPVNWIPFLIPLPPQSTQSTQLEKGATARAIDATPPVPPVPVYAVGRILSPAAIRPRPIA